MRLNARIVLPHGVLVLPLDTPYDAEHLFEQIAWYVARHGRVRVCVDRQEWIVSRATASGTDACRGCGKQPDRLAYARSLRTLCAPCARRELA